MKIKKIPAVLCILICVTTTACSKDKSPTTLSECYFDTVISITLYGDDAEYIDECFDMCSEYEKKLSNKIETSEVSQINSHNGYVEVSEDTLQLIHKGIEYGEVSDGLFDITVGGLSDLWQFGSESPHVPESSLIDEAVRHVNYKNIEIEGNKVRLDDNESKMDLGGIAKGFVADKLKEYLKSKGVNNGIINLGGNILLIGTKPDGSDYNIGIKKPFKENDISATVSISDYSVVSSGNYERYFYEDNRLYHHILDADTGYPVNNNLLSVTIISKESVDGDGLSTTCFALGLDDGMKLIDGIENVEAVFIDSDYKLHCSSGLQNKDGKIRIMEEN